MWQVTVYYWCPRLCLLGHQKHIYPKYQLYRSDTISTSYCIYQNGWHLDDIMYDICFLNDSSSRSAVNNEQEEWSQSNRSQNDRKDYYMGAEINDCNQLSVKLGNSRLFHCIHFLILVFGIHSLIFLELRISWWVWIMDYT